MSRRVSRRWGALLLALFVVLPTTMAGEATAATSQKSTSGKASLSTTPAKKSTARRRTGKRRIRRLPPGQVVWARHAIVLDPSTDEVLYEKSSATSASCASLTKLMTALVFLEQKPELDRVVQVTTAELTGGGQTQLRRGEMVTLEDLLHMSLMVSDNVATRVLARESGLAGEEFVARMNAHAVELGLARTRFVETTGLDERNVSTAADIARLLRAAAANDRIREITTTRSHEFSSRSARGRRIAHRIGNTDRLLYGRYEIRGGKTGFIQKAGYCLATWVRTGSRDMITVVLGAPTNATRFADVVRLVQHTSALSVAPSGL
jgi:D-alanyl-D-alanine endopeptidase (penicillin-binding protein 7)